MTATGSYWIDSAPLPQFPRLTTHRSADVVVIGGGITGLTTAYLLKRQGLTVVLLERDRLAGVDTGCTTAHLTCVTDLPLSSLEKSFGRDHARAVWDAGFAAIETIERIVREHDIACDFAWVPGYLHARPGDRAADLQREAALAAELGFDAEFVNQVPLFGTPGMRVDQQARFHPRKYLAALARRIDGGGSAIFERSPADEVTDDPFAVRSGDATVQCSHLVVATHNPIVGKAGFLGATLLQTKLSLYSSYVIAGRVARGTVPDALFWDTGDPYRYLRLEPQDDFDLVIFGGEDHKTGQQSDTREPYRRLEEAARDLLPSIEITHHWSGQVIETADGLPLIGEMAPRQFAATGFAGNGMTFGTLGAMMAADAIAGRANPWSGLLDIDRTRVRAGLWDYIKENKDYPYYLIRDRFAGAEAKSLRAVGRGEGRIVEVDGRRVAASRDDRGSISLLSPVCTHLGCLVGWNAAERTWDCPCHGSRFRATGEVLSGPAESPLEPIDRRSS